MVARGRSRTGAGVLTEAPTGGSVWPGARHSILRNGGPSVARVDVDAVIEMVKRGAAFYVDHDLLLLRYGARFFLVTNAVSTTYDLYRLAHWLNANRGNTAEIRHALSDESRITIGTMREYPPQQINDPRDAGGDGPDFWLD